MKKRFGCLLLAIALLLPFCASAEYQTTSSYYVKAPTANRVHLRAHPAPNAPSLGLYYTGTPIDSYSASVNSEWASVRIGREQGYMNTSCITRYAPQSAAPDRYVSNRHSTWVNLRQSATTQSLSLGRYDNGVKLTVLGETVTGWSYVQVNGQTGYMMTSMIGDEPQTSTSSSVSVGSPTLLGQSPDGSYIYSYTAPNNQTIYFTTSEKNPSVSMNDVNFDGRNDLVIYTAMGSTNSLCEFYVFDGNRYQHAGHPGSEDGLSNYELHKEDNMVSTRQNNGFAGALNKLCLYQWKGTKLTLLRSATAELLSETLDYSDRSVTTTYQDIILVTVRDEQTGQTLWQEKVNANDSSFLDKEEHVLWQGIRLDELVMNVK